jgi:NADPH:quinone reductase-like Zn-dependent oxidoreductase
LLERYLSLKGATVLALRLREPTGIEGLALEELDVPAPGPGEALVRVHAAALTRDELEWPVDRLPATPSYELSGVVEAIGPDVDGLAPGDEVFALTPFDRDGAAAEYAVVPAAALAPKPRTLGHLEAAALPLAALSAWQGLFDHGRLEPGQRVVIHGAGGGVGHLAVQLARHRGADAVATDRTTTDVEAVVAGADLVFDTVGGDVLARSAGPHVVSVAEEAPGATYFVVEPSRDQLLELAALADAGALRPQLDSVFPLAEARAAFERLAQPGKHGKVVLRVHDA